MRNSGSTKCITGDVPGKDGRQGSGKEMKTSRSLRGGDLWAGARCVAEARKLVYHGLTAVQIIGDSLCLDSGPVSALIEKKWDLTSATRQG